MTHHIILVLTAQSLTWQRITKTMNTLLFSNVYGKDVLILLMHTKQTVVTSAHILLHQDKESVHFIFVFLVLQILTAKQVNT